ncbi:MAG: hypothetical protein RL756_2297 [Pseudomonadota bacterium]|jgi:dTDP-4-amino-4,6-dideoxy-D-galactose acyltransferase
MNDFEILEWDSEFFGFSVARISNSSLDGEALNDVLSDLRKVGTTLVYWPAASRVDAEMMSDLGGTLVDQKTTYVVDLIAQQDMTANADTSIAPVKATTSVSDLESLAVQAGEHSRFAVDPRIPRERFEALYRAWIHQALNQQGSGEVLINGENDRASGMITCGNKNGRGDIGLLAVDASQRGKGLGAKLVRAAQRWFLQKGFRVGQVVTQGSNRAACDLYSRCGYRVDTVEFFYHIWLKED